MSNKMDSEFRLFLPWTLPRLHPPKVVAIAKDNYLTPQYPFPDRQFLPPAILPPKYGQDITFGYNRKAPGNRSVGSTEAELKPKMRKLLDIFAKGDESGMAKRLFDKFLAKQNQVTYFDDNALNAAASKNQNIRDFCDRALNAPRPFYRPTGNIRIHQALKNANWNINRIIVPTDLGVPAFNRGFDINNMKINIALSLGDFNNGLGVMINGMQYVYIVARNYYYSKSDNKYYLVLMFVFYDIFGLDDDDLEEYGIRSQKTSGSDAQEGVTAWWQLQHQYGYAPLVTRIILINNYEIPAI